MSPFAVFLGAVLGAVPGEYEIDCASLPTALTVADYRFKVTVRLSGRPPVESTVSAFKGATPEDVAKALVVTFGDPEWQVERVGTRVRVLACGKSRVCGISLTGDIKPALRLVLPQPEKKK